jgi:hypothetical protein
MTMRNSVLLVLFICFASAQAEVESLVPRLERHERPPGNNGPTPVEVNVFLVDILSVDDVDRTLTVDYFLAQSWKDPRLADDQFADPAAKLDLGIEDIWNPHLSVVNVHSSMLQESIINIDVEGNVMYRQRRVDIVTTPLDLRQFPFDTQVVRLKFLSTVYGPTQIEVEWSEERSGYLEPFSVTGWEFHGFSTSETELVLRSGGGQVRTQTGINLEISLERQSAFYFWKVIFPLAFIVFMAWTVFWIDPMEFGGQVAISTASVITLIAFQLSLVELLPKISYLTRIDIYAVGTSFLVFFALGESILTARLAKIDRHELALRIDRHMRWIYPVVYTVMLLLLVFV